MKDIQASTMLGGWNSTRLDELPAAALVADPNQESRRWRHGADQVASGSRNTARKPPSARFSNDAAPP